MDRSDSSLLRLWCLFAAILSGSVGGGAKPPADLYESYTGFSMSAEPVLPAQESHPSLWFKAADLPALRTRLAADDFARSRWAAVKKLADLGQPMPVAPTAGDKTEVIHKYYGTMSMAARAHALLALLADDEAARAAHRRRAVELLLRAYDGPIFELDSSIKGSPVDEIYRGTWLQNYAHAYDCVQPGLAPDTDAQIRTRLAHEAQCVYENLYRWAPDSPHNHLSKPAWGLGSLALALSSDPRARAWLGRALEAANRNTRYFFSGDGLYREGSHYLVFSLTNFVPFLWHYRNVSGVDGFATFQPVFEAMVEVRNGRGWLPNIEDSYLRPTPTHLVAAAYRDAKTRLHSRAPLAEILAWSHRAGDMTPFERERSESGFNYTGASWDYPLEIDELLTHDPALRATAPDAAPNRFLAGGQAVLRSGWEHRGAGQRHLLFHGVAVADNHNHHDQLSFILEAEGQLMCSDSGYSRGTYAGPERTAWYNTAPAHNTLTFDGKPAGAAPFNETPLSAHWEQPGLVVVQKTQFHLPKSAVWKRTICWIAGDYYAVIDRVDSKQGMDIKAYLHGGRGTLATHGAERTWTYSADRYGSAAKLRSWIAAPGAQVETKEGELTYIKGDYATFPYLEIAWAKAAAPTIMLLKPAGADEAAAFQVEDRSAGGRTVLVVTGPDEKTVMAAGSGPASIDGVECDAAFFVVRRDQAGQVLNHFTEGGSYLRIDGRELPVHVDAALRRPITTVMDKQIAAPSGDPHDYVSFARYWWPDPTKPDGLPYVGRDGHHNHAQVAKGDRNRIGDFCSTVAKLATAWHANRDEAAARRAGEWLRAWFLAPATRMNPHLEYAQVRLGHNGNHGSPAGVLDARDFAHVIAALRLLDDSPALTAAEKDGIRAWFTTYLDWLLNAPNARAERAAKNNHGTWYFAHVIPVARFTGRDDLARELVLEARDRIAQQIRPDGSQPEEIRRVDGLGYSRFNLEAWFAVVRLAKELGINLWDYTAPNGASLRQALDFLRPYNAAPGKWPHTQKAKLAPGFLDPLLAQTAEFSAQPQISPKPGSVN